MTDAALGQGEKMTGYIGGCEDDIKPGTPRWMFPFALLHRFIPKKLPKSPRNMQKFIEKHKKG